MKIVNMLKLKEEFDYESLCRKLEKQVDQLTEEIERQQMSRKNDKDEMEKRLRECQDSFAKAEKNQFTRSEVIFSPFGVCVCVCMCFLGPGYVLSIFQS